MKKLLCALLIGALCACVLAGCKKQAAPEAAPEADFAPGNASPAETAVPEEGGHGETDQSAALASMPTLAPVETVEPQSPEIFVTMGESKYSGQMATPQRSSSKPCNSSFSPIK